jgi:hypothetical protein
VTVEPKIKPSESVGTDIIWFIAEDNVNPCTNKLADIFIGLKNNFSKLYKKPKM